MAMKEQDKKVLQVGLFLAGLVLAAALVAKSQFLAVKHERLENQITDLEGAIRDQQALKNDLLNLADREDEINAMAQRIVEASRRLPEDINAREFYGALADIVETTRLDWSQLLPVRARTHQLYTEIPYTVDASASYHEFGQFMNLLEMNPDRFMRVSHIDISGLRDRPTKHQTNLEITTFVLHRVPVDRG